MYSLVPLDDSPVKYFEKLVAASGLPRLVPVPDTTAYQCLRSSWARKQLARTSLNICKRIEGVRAL